MEDGNGWLAWLEESRREWCRWVRENEESLERHGRIEEWHEEEEADND